MNLFDTLKKRGLIYQSTDEGSLKKALEKPLTLYQGFDPSADSFHIGNLVGLMVLHRFQKAGHKVICLIGGGTGRVGDPTDKQASRKMLTKTQIQKNSQSLKKQLEKLGLLTFSGSNPATMVDNDAWLSKYYFLEDFMVDIATHFSVNDMIKMRTFADRIDNDKPLSLFEFIYPIMQGWDYKYLNENYNCTLQIGGHDQWVNIISGVDLIRRSLNKTVHAATIPLLTTSDGRKMGKTEAGAIWLDPEKTSPYDFYQYFVKTPDDSVEMTFKALTFLDDDEISEILKDPIKAQKRLAYEITKLVHGEDEASAAREAENAPELKLFGRTITVVDALVESGCLPSKTEARRRIEQGGVSVDGTRIDDPNRELGQSCTVKYGKGKLLKIAA